MNARQKAKWYKRKYEECINKPVKVVTKSVLPEHYCFKREMNFADLFDIGYTDEGCKNASKDLFLNEFSYELKKLIKSNNITVHHYKKGHQDVFETELYLGFDKEGLIEDDIYK